MDAVDLSDKQQRRRFLTATDPDKRLANVADWQAYFTQKIDGMLKGA